MKISTCMKFEICRAESFTCINAGQTIAVGP